MKHINLLPPVKQKHVKNVYLFLFARFICTLLLFITIVISLVLGGASYLLNESITQVTLHSNTIDKEFTTINKDIGDVNANLKQIDFVLTQKKEWTPLLMPVLQAIDTSSMSLNGVSFNADGTLLTLQGKAATRTALLDAQTRLKQLAFVSDATVPLDNLIKQDNIEFQMTVNLKH